MIEDKKFDEKFLKSIKEKKITPTPRWHFRLKEYVIWGTGIIFLLVGAVSISLIIHMVRLSSFEVYRKTAQGPFEFFFLIVPIFWLVLLIVFTLVVYFDYKKTKNAYRHSPLVIIAVVALSSLGLGSIFSNAGLGERIDDAIGRRAPENFYRQVINPHMEYWSHPEEGRLMGLVIAENNESEYGVLDARKKEWILVIEKGNAGRDVLIVGRPVRAIGEKISDNEFVAKEIFSMPAGRGFMMKIGGMPMPGMGGKYEMQIPGKFLGDRPPEDMMFMKMRKNCELGNELSSILEKYPELKEAFIVDLKENKNIKSMIEGDPEFNAQLFNLDIDKKIIEELSNK